MLELPFVKLAIAVGVASLFIKRTDIPVIAKTGGFILGRVVGLFPFYIWLYSILLYVYHLFI